MFRHLATVAAGSLLFAAGGAFAQTAQDDREVSIAFAGNGGIRDWQPGPAGSNIVYLRDRTQRWYRVQLSGPCAEEALEALSFDTGVTGSFDRFSRVSSVRNPERVCGVESVRRSAPPPGKGGPRKRR